MTITQHDDGDPTPAELADALALVQSLPLEALREEWDEEWDEPSPFDRMIDRHHAMCCGFHADESFVGGSIYEH